jgi:DNA-directed RNA polymerase I, II, and III subunit RPABC1
MDDINSLFQARKTVIEMLTDRGFVVPKDFHCDKLSDFKTLFSNKKCDIFIKEPRLCYVKFILQYKIRPNALRDIVTQLVENELSEGGDLIIITRNKPNSALQKITRTFKGLQIFWVKHLVINITKHQLNPKFIVLDEDNIEVLLKKYNLTSRFQLPVMLKDDPISQYFGLKSSSVCQVIRRSVSSGEHNSYRCVR